MARGGEFVSLKDVRARLSSNSGLQCSAQCVGEYLSQWAEERGYSPVIELGGTPDKLPSYLVKADADLWRAAQAEAAIVLERERLRMTEAIGVERELRHEALGRVDTCEAMMDAQRTEIARLNIELAKMEKHLHDVRAREFWNRVAHEIWEKLPGKEPLHVTEITRRIDLRFVQEAEEYSGEWGPTLIRGVIDQRVKHRRLFASEGKGRFRRRVPADDAA